MYIAITTYFYFSTHHTINNNTPVACLKDSVNIQIDMNWTPTNKHSLSDFCPNQFPNKLNSMSSKSGDEFLIKIKCSWMHSIPSIILTRVSKRRSKVPNVWQISGMSCFILYSYVAQLCLSNKIKVVRSTGVSDSRIHQHAFKTEKSSNAVELDAIRGKKLNFFSTAKAKYQTL